MCDVCTSTVQRFKIPRKFNFQIFGANLYCNRENFYVYSIQSAHAFTTEAVIRYTLGWELKLSR